MRLIKKIICWWKGHDYEIDFFRAPVYQYFELSKNHNKYNKIDMDDDLNKIQSCLVNSYINAINRRLTRCKRCRIYIKR